MTKRRIVLALQNLRRRLVLAFHIAIGSETVAMLFSHSKPPPYTATGLLEEYVRDKARPVFPAINWHAVAIQMAQQWLQAHTPEDLHEVAFADNAEMVTKLSDQFAMNEVPKLRHPYCIVVWRGRGDACGIQIIGEKARA